jgi:hypothetical protein
MQALLGLCARNERPGRTVRVVARSPAPSPRAAGAIFTFRTSGRIASRRVEIGDHVEADDDDIVAELDSRIGRPLSTMRRPLWIRPDAIASGAGDLRSLAGAGSRFRVSEDQGRAGNQSAANVRRLSDADRDIGASLLGVTMLPRRLARRDERPSRPMGAFTAVLAASCGGASRHCAGQGAPTRRRPAKRFVAAPRRGLDGARRIALRASGAALGSFPFSLEARVEVATRDREPERVVSVRRFSTSERSAHRVIEG